jgi:hypothetical protein|tara:strand:+ start:142 stop:501 length:360 start_codon:yes stop_codon:yes gene_type:complete
MKTIIVALLLSFVITGCAFLDVKKHDPGLSSGYVDLKMSLNMADCTEPFTIYEAYYQAEWINEYSKFTSDPLVKNTENIIKYLERAHEASDKLNLPACDRWLNLVKINMKILKTDWGTR